MDRSSTTRLSCLVTCSLACFVFDANGALDIAFALVSTQGNAPCGVLAVSATFAFALYACRGAVGEPTSHVRVRAYVALGAICAPLIAISHARLASVGLIATALALAELVVRARLRFALCVAMLPAATMAIVILLAALDVDAARAAYIRRATIESITLGKTVYVERWGFVDVLHAHPATVHGVGRSLAPLGAGPGRVRAYVEIVDALHDVYVVDRWYDVPPFDERERGIYACAIALDIGERAERAQARAAWWHVLRMSAYESEDLPSNLIGCLHAIGELAPRTVIHDRNATLARYRKIARPRSYAHVRTYGLPAGATDRERFVFARIQSVRLALEGSPVRMYLHPSAS